MLFKLSVRSKWDIYLRSQVKHSRTSSVSSYEKDLSELIKLYTKNNKSLKALLLNSPDDLPKDSSCSPTESTSELDEMRRTVHDSDDCEFLDDDGCLDSLEEEELTVQYLEDDCDQVQGVDDLDGIDSIL